MTSVLQVTYRNDEVNRVADALFEFVDRSVNPMGNVRKEELRAPYWKGRQRHG